MPEITLPAYGWEPRSYQMPAWSALERGVKRLALAWHRRSGKDELALHWAACSAMERVGPYWHMLPMASQARKAIWDAVNPRTGRRRIDDAFPPEIRESTRENDMFIRFKGGSTWQVVGSDNFNSLVGSPPVGIVFSEYALADPSAWAMLRPILLENDGWALFISTTRGRNHFQKLVEFAKQDESWYGETLTVEDTGAISAEAIAREKRELTVERGDDEAKAIIAQEYYCDADASIPGSYYGALMSKAAKEDRIGVFPWIPNEPVGTAWDLGHGDSTVIWCFQQPTSGKVRIIDVIASNGVGIDWYVRKLKDRPYNYVDHIWPHDGGHGNIRDVGGDTLKITAGKLGLKPLRVLANDMSIEHGIGAVRTMLAITEFNTDPMPFDDETPDEARQRMARAIDAIKQYRREWSEKLQRFSDVPLHDWASDFADGLRYLARARRPFISGGWGVLKVSELRLWKARIPLPDFEFVVQSYRTAFTEHTHGFPTACTVWGVFTYREQKQIMLLDAWAEHLGYPELRKRAIRDWQATYGGHKQTPIIGNGNITTLFDEKHPPRRADVVLLEDKGSGQSLMQDLRAARVPVVSYNKDGADELNRAHQIAPILESGHIWLLESKVEPDQPISWARKLIAQCEAVPNNDEWDLVDTFSQAMIYLRDAGMIAMDEVPLDEPEEFADTLPRKPVNPYNQ